MRILSTIVAVATVAALSTPAFASNNCRHDSDTTYKPVYSTKTQGFSGPGAAKSGSAFPAFPISLHDLTSGPNIAFITTTYKSGYQVITTWTHQNWIVVKEAVSRNEPNGSNWERGRRLDNGYYEWKQYGWSAERPGKC